MAHFARLENNLVTEVIVVNNDVLLVDGVESEAKGVEFCQSLFGGEWKQTSYNKNFRKNYAGIGYSWDGTGFSPPQPYPSWIKDEETYLWVAPVPKPDSGMWVWDEPTISWKEYEVG